MLSATRASAIAEAIRAGALSRLDPKDQLCAQSFRSAFCHKLDATTPADILEAWEQAEREDREWLEQTDDQTIAWAIRMACT